MTLNAHPSTQDDAKTILVCDDEATLRELVRAVLGNGYRFIEADDGEQAIELARSERPQLIILDIMLPRRSGLEVLTEIRRDAELASVPVIVITAWSHAENAARRAGADRFLEKPFDPDALRNPVEELLRT